MYWILIILIEFSIVFQLINLTKNNLTLFYLINIKQETLINIKQLMYHLKNLRHNQAYFWFLYILFLGL